MKLTDRLIPTLLAAAAFAACSSPGRTDLEVSQLFADNMILQQNAQTVICGRATPGTRVSVQTDWDYASTGTARPDSIWQALIVTPAGSHKLRTITVSTADTVITFDKVLIGEVWLAAGHSNMAQPLRGWPGSPVDSSRAAIEHSRNLNIRVFDVENSPSATRQSIVVGSWKDCHPQTAKDFSATAYFFARELEERINVPVGIICATTSYGRGASWVDAETLSSIDVYADFVDTLGKVVPRIEQYEKWVRRLPRVNTQAGGLPTVYDEYVNKGNPALDDWDEATLPSTFENSGIGYLDGMVWYVRTVSIPQEWLGRDLQMHLGPIDDCDVAYFDGNCVGSTEERDSYDQSRVYTVPGRLVGSTSVRIAIRVINFDGRGGFMASQPDEMFLKPVNADRLARQTVSLAGQWKYCIAAQCADGQYYAFDIRNNKLTRRMRPRHIINNDTPTALFNGLIAPIGGYALAGALVSIGETDVGDAATFRKVMPAIARCWRRHLGTDVSIYFSQITPWHYNGKAGFDLAAELREAQYDALADIGNSGLVSTVDLCDSTALFHTPFKWQVGHRFAAMAVASHYRMGGMPSGPQPRFDDIRVVGKVLGLTFDHGEGMTFDNYDNNIFEVAGADSVFYPATASIDQDRMMLFSHVVVNPLYVRYAHSGSGSGILYNADGLPAPAFSNLPTYIK